MNYKIFSKLIIKEEQKFIHIFSSDKNILYIDVIITLPENINNKMIENIILLTTLKIIEPFIRCGLSFEIVSEYNFDTLLSNLVEDNNIDDEIYLYTNLNWVKDNISYTQIEKIEFEVEINNYFINKNTISISDKKLANKYKEEIGKSLPFAIYERLRAECDYAWRCAECPKGISGECDAILYEQYIQAQNQ